ncbi:MAG: aminotransferase class V-fold PLP-dependent enzyme, partial [Thermodesulfovibrionales bacterium]|nr:aminotransferase class V-fold PLP-dependent enzyme [Thermodesulfovibrionales bacterium]
SQEFGMRAGTENVPGIVGVGAACRVAMREMRKRHDELGAMRDRLERGILEAVPGVVVNGHAERRVYNTLNMSFPGIEGEALMTLLNQEGIAVSTGSACASDSGKPSRILGAMGLDAVRSRGTLRISLGYGNSEQDIDYVLEKLPPLANRLIEMSPLGS